MPLTMFLTVAAVLFYFAFEAENPRRKALFLVFFGVAVGCAFLTKGFLVFAVLCAAIVPFMLWERRTGKLLRLAWLPLLTMALVALPWCLMIHRREPDFWPQFFWEQHCAGSSAGGRSMASRRGSSFHGSSAAFCRGRRSRRRRSSASGRKSASDPLVRFALCWLAFPFLFFSICQRQAAHVHPALLSAAGAAGRRGAAAVLRSRAAQGVRRGRVGHHSPARCGHRGDHRDQRDRRNASVRAARGGAAIPLPAERTMEMAAAHFGAGRLGRAMVLGGSAAPCGEPAGAALRGAVPFHDGGELRGPASRAGLLRAGGVPRARFRARRARRAAPCALRHNSRRRMALQTRGRHPVRLRRRVRVRHHPLGRQESRGRTGRFRLVRGTIPADEAGNGLMEKDVLSRP